MTLAAKFSDLTLAVQELNKFVDLGLVLIQKIEIYLDKIGCGISVEIPFVDARSKMHTSRLCYGRFGEPSRFQIFIRCQDQCLNYGELRREDKIIIIQHLSSLVQKIHESVVGDVQSLKFRTDRLQEMIREIDENDRVPEPERDQEVRGG